MNSTNQEIRIPSIKDGDTFRIGDMEFIKFPDKDGMTPVVMKDIAFTSRFGDNNNLKESKVLQRMQEEILPKIVAAIGEESICTVKTDLTTLDGLKPYGELTSLISLPTLDFYRANVEIFDKYNPGRWWWLATPESTKPHDDPYWTICVSPSGRIIRIDCDIVIGVRPFLNFKSSIFESLEEAHG